MALIKEVINKYGHKSEYHIIEVVKKYVIKRLLFKDKEFRQSKGHGLRLTDILMPLDYVSEEKLKLEGNSETTLGYQYLKENCEEYAGAEDDL